MRRAIASCRRSSDSSTSAEALVGRNRQVRQEARCGRNYARAAAGCGAYKIKEFVAGRSIAFERVKDYWGRALNVNVGRDNFDEIRYEYFRDTTVALEAFKADQVDWRSENSAKNWANRLAFPRCGEASFSRNSLIRNVGVMQAFVFNTRRPRFQDPRVRRASISPSISRKMNKQIFAQ